MSRFGKPLALIVVGVLIAASPVPRCDIDGALTMQHGCTKAVADSLRSKTGAETVALLCNRLVRYTNQCQPSGAESVDSLVAMIRLDGAYGAAAAYATLGKRTRANRFMALARTEAGRLILLTKPGDHLRGFAQDILRRSGPERLY